MELICHGCLNNVVARSKIKDPETLKCYSFLVEKQKETILDVSICWICQSLMDKFVKFKRKLQNSYRLIQQMTQGDSTLNIEWSAPLYQQIVLYNIHFNPDLALCEGFEIISNKFTIKTEILKEEISDRDNDDDLFSEPIDTLEIIETDKAIEKDPPIKSVKKRLAGNEKMKKVYSGKKNTKKVTVNLKKKSQTQSESKQDCFKEVVLSEKEVAEERSMLSKHSNYVSALYKCGTCIVSFPNLDDMEDHSATKHNPDNKLKCDICLSTFASTLSLTYHTNRHTVRYECNRCQRRFETRAKAGRHYAEYHDAASLVEGYACVLCDVAFSTEIELCIHKRSQQHTTASSLETLPPLGDMHSCKLCDKSFKWRTSLNKHLEKHRIASGLKRRPFCELCSLTFTHSASLKKHVKSSSKHQMLLNERNAREGHSTEFVSARERQFPCPLCDKWFQWKGNLQRHISSHAARAAGELVCVPCDRTFSSIATYRQHLKISKKHVSQDDFQHKCSECDAKFVNKSKLKEHVDWEHLKNYTHSCDTCKKVFKSHTSLYLHRQVVHVKDGTNHLCDHCGKSFAHVGKLRSHMSAMHSEKARYKCTICGTTFNWHSCLTRHVKLVHKQKVSRDLASLKVDANVSGIPPFQHSK